jgi:Vitamin K-dependent gamma-carboxylase
MDRFIFKPIPVFPLVTFRITFGILMFASTVRFMAYGWVEQLFLKPKFFFTYPFFDWVQPFSAPFMYLLFIVTAWAAVCIALGLFYRVACILFFLCFTYVELIDKTNYLNHYYFVSLVALLLIFIPANAFFSLDNKLGLKTETQTISAWSINILKFQIGVLYFFAGIAKINSDWLIEALPLKIWLPAKTSVPLIGCLFQNEYVPYLFSWFGMLFDICIPFVLLSSKWSIYGYLLVVVFHVLTWCLFPIGVFPWVMICTTLLFFSADFHKNIYVKVYRFFGFPFDYKKTTMVAGFQHNVIKICLLIFVVFQLVMPLRNLLYSGKLSWNEHGYRFSWRVMLMEKMGYIQFLVKDKCKNSPIFIQNKDFLTPLQEKMMATQPDMILQFAHFLANKYKSNCKQGVNIYAESYVSLNGKGSKVFIDPNVDLAQEEINFKQKKWIINY